MYKIGASTNSYTVNEDMFVSMKKTNVTDTEISFGNYNGYKDFDFEKTKKLADKYDINLWSLHLPFAPFEEIDPSTEDENIKKFTFDIFTDLIKKGAEIGIDKFVVHASREPIFPDKRKIRLENAAKFLSELADFAAEFNAIILIEDLPRTCIGNNSNEINYLLSANDKLKVCFDTNHLLNEEIPHFIESVGKNIVSTHISDYDFKDERHWLPGNGDIDWLELANSLKKVDYNGVWMYELDFNPYAETDENDLTYTDLYNNAFEILNGKEPTSIKK